uniref:DUF5688 family protein n=1 Tax=Acetatifactor sp. TaxID=1872090 RepID=UPI004056A596
MTKETFFDAVKEQVLAVLQSQGDILDAVIQEVKKTNGVVYNGLTIKDGSNVAPVIYLDEFYNRYEDGVSINECTEKIVEIYKANRCNGDFDISCITDFERVKDRIIVSLYNAEANAENLADMPHKDFADLSIYYRIELSMDDAVGSVVIHNNLMSTWGKTVDEINTLAWENMKRMHPPVFQGMGEVVKELLDIELDEVEEEFLENPPMFVFTASNKVNGAVYMADMQELARISEQLKDDLCILPSSRHEVIILPANFINRDGDYTHLKEMVQEVNATQVAPEDFLSDNVYFFKRATDELKLVA